jgi:hypothetical protein
MDSVRLPTEGVGLIVTVADPVTGAGHTGAVWYATLTRLYVNVPADVVGTVKGTEPDAATFILASFDPPIL